MLKFIVSIIFLFVSATQANSQVMCLPAITKGLVLANPENTPWNTTNETQKLFFSLYVNSSIQSLPALEEYIEGTVAYSGAELSKWFAKHGFPDMNIQVPVGGKAIGTVFDLLVDWKIPGLKKSMYIKKTWYEGVEMEIKESAVNAFHLEGYQYPLFELATTQEWSVFLIEADEKIDTFNLPQKSKELLSLPRQPANFVKLQFPQVKMKIDVDVKWMKGLNCTMFSVDEVIQKIKLRLDDKGARAQSALAMVLKGFSFYNPYLIKKPFFVICWKPGLEFAPFVALVEPSYWVKLNR